MALPDLIVLDWNLPKVSGAEVLGQLKQHKHLRRIPVLIFSASKMDTDIHAAYDNYANGYVLKPAGNDPLTAIVEIIEHRALACSQRGVA
jgi:CheY-like chemotaxis protein